MTANTSNNILRSILDKEKLSGTNFLDWHRNLRIVLKHDKKLHVLETPVPEEEPPSSAPKAERDAYKKHVDDANETACLMLATMNSELQKQHENMSAFDMIEHLKLLYQVQARHERPTKHGDKGKGKEVAKPKPTIDALKPNGGIAKEGTCFHCGKTGHWKRNCPKYLEDKKNGVETSTSGIFVINSSTSASWVLDTGCGSHTCTNVQGMKGSRDLAKGEVDLRVANGAKVNKTPYKIWSGKRPHMSYIKIWGCEVYVKRQISTKLEPKSDKCLFVGYPKETKGYYVYNPSEGKVFVARTGVFLEKDFISKGTSGRKVELEEIQESQSIDTPMEELEQETQVVV
ncbi:hypothetical protein KIW84_022655 [Lathyrus oleraceus]|uniref:CCHC-type domain-containing protein n=1 Tax=Pisum sativum TaxID=3888 RepID=A0A9D5BB00_PEA|nr:hypothetical protein KIW84_022655 [Pisum sativum]